MRRGPWPWAHGASGCGSTPASVRGDPIDPMLVYTWAAVEGAASHVASMHEPTHGATRGVKSGPGQSAARQRGWPGRSGRLRRAYLPSAAARAAGDGGVGAGGRVGGIGSGLGLGGGGTGTGQGSDEPAEWPGLPAARTQGQRQAPARMCLLAMTTTAPQLSQRHRHHASLRDENEWVSGFLARPSTSRLLKRCPASSIIGLPPPCRRCFRLSAIQHLQG